jgi:Leucine-rich repeat (LRR) protein
MSRTLDLVALAESVSTARSGWTLECAYDSREGAPAAEGAVPKLGLPCSFGECTFNTNVAGQLFVLGICTSSSPILYLNGKNITSIASAVFKNIPSTLRRIFLNDNYLVELSPGIFNSLESLEYLRLNNNLFTYLSPEAFSSFASLRYLYLGGNRLTELPKGIFSPLSRLEYMYLENNKLTRL